MRHRKQNKKLGRSKAHREALIPMLVVGLIKSMSIQTTVQKAKVARQLADKMVTLARKNDVNARRRAAAQLQDAEAVKKLFTTIAPMMEGRPGGYTRIVKIGRRPSDGSEMCVLAWVTEKYEPKAEADDAPVQEAAQA
ncbi:MAG: 50S ribosomal protein L17 [Kiritimatiellia bacterium]|jgi:large subunit ribosomal protein L17